MPGIQDMDSVDEIHVDEGVIRTVREQEIDEEMSLKRRYFLSSKENFQSAQSDRITSKLYVYKHEFPQIVVRFRQPRRTTIGYELSHVQIIYFPFYDQTPSVPTSKSPQPFGPLSTLHKFSQINPNAEVISLEYRGQIIVGMESEIFNEEFKRYILNLIQQKGDGLKGDRNKRKRWDRDDTDIEIGISAVFDMILRQWLNSDVINTMFIVSDKNFKSFASGQTGLIQVQVLKTTQYNLHLHFYDNKSQKNPGNQQKNDTFDSNVQKKNIDSQLEDNKKHYFEYEFINFSLQKQSQDLTELQKLGFIAPGLITINEFFYEVLIMMLNEFQEIEKLKLQQIKKQEQKKRIKDALLNAARDINTRNKLMDQQQFSYLLVDKKKVKQDSLDIKINKLYQEQQNKKTLLKKLNNPDPQPSIIQHNYPDDQNQTERQQQNNSSMQKSDPSYAKYQNRTKKKSQIKLQEISLIPVEVQVIQGLQGEIFEEQLNNKPPRRFITKSQYLKLKQFRLRYQLGREINPQSQVGHQNCVFIGIKDTQDQLKGKNPSPNQQPNHQKSSSPPKSFADNYFNTHSITIPLLNPNDETYQQHQYSDETLEIYNFEQQWLRKMQLQKEKTQNKSKRVNSFREELSRHLVIGQDNNVENDSLEQPYREDQLDEGMDQNIEGPNAQLQMEKDRRLGYQCYLNHVFSPKQQVQNPVSTAPSVNSNQIAANQAPTNNQQNSQQPAQLSPITPHSQSIIYRNKPSPAKINKPKQQQSSPSKSQPKQPAKQSPRQQLKQPKQIAKSQPKQAQQPKKQPTIQQPEQQEESSVIRDVMFDDDPRALKPVATSEPSPPQNNNVLNSIPKKLKEQDFCLIM